MIGDISVFDKVVKTEDSYTQVLCNLMILDGEFRTQIRSRLLNAKVAPTVTARDIRTQVILKESGRPDVEIQTIDLYALIEVKLNPRRGCTLHQDPVVDSAGYSTHLSTEVRQSRRWLVYLVPPDWVHHADIKAKLTEMGKHYPEIKTAIVLWGDVLEILEQENLSTQYSVLDEFRKLLANRFGPVRFSTKEINMFFSKDIPIRAIRKLDYLIEQIAQRSEKKGFKPCRTKPNDDKDGEEHGLNFKSADGKDLLWFGAWTAFWEQEGFPLCFGIDSKWSIAAPSLPEAFSASCKSAPVQFEGWSVAWIPKEILDGDNPVDKIWGQLEPILRDVYNSAK